ncbi:MAG: VIT domain-containing protein [Candidatus Erginobacter occultus]|nr:VIT domain-containing protein [Candidatus Erginobacter occultus]
MGTPRIRWVLASALILIVLSPPPLRAAFPEPEIPFSRKILTVLSQGLESSPPAGGDLSIPLTRLDVMIRDGIAFTRLIQVYRNHSDTNQGFAFSLPLEPDTAVTGFTIWDRGTRYPGAIADRPRAEEAYREVTGDEVPALVEYRDPGLVRANRDTFEMRVFPIFPGEDKQVELVWQRRLPMKNGRYRLSLPLAALTRPDDPRHPGLESRVTDVSVYIEDDLPVIDLEFPEGFQPAWRIDDRRLLLREVIDKAPDQDPEISYRLKIDRFPAVKTKTFSDAGENYFLTRVLARPEESLLEFPEGGEEKPPFYLGVWHESTAPAEAGLFEALTEELGGFLTLLSRDRRNFLQGSWLIAPRDQPLFGDLRGVMTERRLRLGVFLADEFNRLENWPAESIPDTPEDVIAHLSRSLAEDNCDPVYLFLDSSSPLEFPGLRAVIAAHPSVRFFLVVRDGQLPDDWTGKNIRLYSLSGGWQGEEAPPAGGRLILTDGSFDELWLGITRRESLKPFLTELPDPDPALVALRLSGGPGLAEVSVFPGPQPGSKAPAVPGETIGFWVSGRFDRPGKLSGELTLSSAEFGEIFGGEEKKVEILRVDFTAGLEIAGEGNRWVGTFTAMNRVSRLNLRIALLENPVRGREPSSADAEEAARLRAESARLSREFSFISSETAFIALPEDLREKYGFLAQRYQAGEIYQPLAGGPGVIPEPETWAMLVIGALAGLYFFRRRRSHIQGTGPGPK